MSRQDNITSRYIIHFVLIFFKRISFAIKLTVANSMRVFRTMQFSLPGPFSLINIELASAVNEKRIQMYRRKTHQEHMSTFQKIYCKISAASRPVIRGLRIRYVTLSRRPTSYKTVQINFLSNIFLTIRKSYKCSSSKFEIGENRRRVRSLYMISGIQSSWRWYWTHPYFHVQILPIKNKQ